MSKMIMERFNYVSIQISFGNIDQNCQKFTLSKKEKTLLKLIFVPNVFYTILSFVEKFLKEFWYDKKILRCIYITIFL